MWGLLAILKGPGPVIGEKVEALLCWPAVPPALFIQPLIEYGPPRPGELKMIDPQDDEQPRRRIRPRGDARTNLIRHLRPITTLGFVVLLIASLYWAQEILIPVALAILLAFLLSPLVTLLERRGLPQAPAIIMVVLLAFSVLGSIGWATTLQVGHLINELPRYQSNIQHKIADLEGVGQLEWFRRLQQTLGASIGGAHQESHVPADQQAPVPVVVQPTASVALQNLPTIVGTLLKPVAAASLVVVLVIFMLAGRRELRNRLIHIIGYSSLSITTKALEEAGQRVSRYLLMQTVVNFSFGLLIGAGLFLIGLPYAILWGFLAGVLRFIPYVGIWLAAILPVVLSLAVFAGWLWPFAILALFLALEFCINMLVEPRVYGASSGVSEVALLIAVAFWTWLWGPVGLVLATPLTVCLVVIGKYFPRLEAIVVLMGNRPVMESSLNVYQRLVAGDQVEAQQIVLEQLKAHPLVQVYDDVLIPVLNRAREDCQHGKLEPQEKRLIVEHTREIVRAIGRRQLRYGEAGAGKGRTAPKMRLLVCPADEESDRVVQVMLAQLLNPAHYVLDMLSKDKLSSEVVRDAEQVRPDLVVVASLCASGLEPVRLLCKRLHQTMPAGKVLVGRWGYTLNDADRESLLAAGADQIAPTLLETRHQISEIALLMAGGTADMTAEQPPSRKEKDSAGQAGS